MKLTLPIASLPKMQLNIPMNVSLSIGTDSVTSDGEDCLQQGSVPSESNASVGSNIGQPPEIGYPPYRVPDSNADTQHMLKFYEMREKVKTYGKESGGLKCGKMPHQGNSPKQIGNKRGKEPDAGSSLETTSLGQRTVSPVSQPVAYAKSSMPHQIGQCDSPKQMTFKHFSLEDPSPDIVKYDGKMPPQIGQARGDSSPNQIGKSGGPDVGSSLVDTPKINLGQGVASPPRFSSDIDKLSQLTNSIGN